MVIIATSIVTGSFFITKTYINSQRSIKEKEMGIQFRRDLGKMLNRVVDKMGEESKE